MTEHPYADAPVYQVYLRPDVDVPGVESPVHTKRIDFYDAGVWVMGDDERLFLPYHRIQVIREGRENTEELGSGAAAGDDLPGVE
ncbi:MAG: hypothetical protein ABEJ27_03550 [Halodesulfurarchaeum sp.]